MSVYLSLSQCVTFLYLVVLSSVYLFLSVCRLCGSVSLGLDLVSSLFVRFNVTCLYECSVCMSACSCLSSWSCFPEFLHSCLPLLHCTSSCLSVFGPQFAGSPVSYIYKHTYTWIISIWIETRKNFHPRASATWIYCCRFDKKIS